VSVVDKAYQALSDFNLWIKVQVGDPLSMADIPALIELRLSYVVENWSEIANLISQRVSSYSDTNRLKQESLKFEGLVELLRVGKTSRPSATRLLERYFTVFDVLLVDDIPTSRVEEDLVSAEKSRVDLWNKRDIIRIRELMASGRDAIADRIGGSDEDYNRIYERSALPQLLNKLPEYIELMLQFQVSIDSATLVLANSRGVFGSTATVDPFAFARANANNPNIDIRTFKSGRLTRLNYGESLQTLAKRTMGDPERWIEISIANGLKPPYIDEIGVRLPLIVNANKNIFNIAKLHTDGTPNLDRIYIGQIIILSSDIEKVPDQRVVVNFRQIPVSGEILVEVDGEADLDKYKKIDNAVVRVYQKNTINSNFFVLIPSSEEPPPEINNEVPWFLRSSKRDEKAAGVDILVDDSGDLVFGADQDLVLSYGVSNALQALKILMSTEKASMQKHPTYGLTAVTGNKNTKAADLKQTLTEDIAQQVMSDDRFDRLDYLDVQYLDGASGFRVRLGVILSGGGSNVIPISFNVSA
jgi:hypothetical protein